MADKLLTQTDVTNALRDTEYKGKAKDIYAYLKRKNILTLNKIDNLPRLGFILGCDPYSIVAAIRKSVLNPEPIVKPKKELKHDNN